MTQAQLGILQYNVQTVNVGSMAEILGTGNWSMTMSYTKHSLLVLSVAKCLVRMHTVGIEMLMSKSSIVLAIFIGISTKRSKSGKNHKRQTAWQSKIVTQSYF